MYVYMYTGIKAYRYTGIQVYRYTDIKFVFLQGFLINSRIFNHVSKPFIIKAQVSQHAFTELKLD